MYSGTPLLHRDRIHALWESFGLPAGVQSGGGDSCCPAVHGHSDILCDGVPGEEELHPPVSRQLLTSLEAQGQGRKLMGFTNELLSSIITSCSGAAPRPKSFVPAVLCRQSCAYVLWVLATWTCTFAEGSNQVSSSWLLRRLKSYV